ncbi:MAG: HAD hydrolase family protein [Planctomycetota bacterium]
MDQTRPGSLGGVPIAFVLDVDGVMTDGRSVYTEAGKVQKVFGPDDHDALCLLRETLDIHFVSGDRRGFPISAARIERDMGFPIEAVSSIDRLAWIGARWSAEQVIYMGDGIYDHLVFRGVGYGICVADGDADARAEADYVTVRRGGDRAVAEACKHIMDLFFGGRQRFFEAAQVGRGPAVAGDWSSRATA